MHRRASVCSFTWALGIQTQVLMLGKCFTADPLPEKGPFIGLPPGADRFPRVARVLSLQVRGEDCPAAAPLPQCLAQPLHLLSHHVSSTLGGGARTSLGFIVVNTVESNNHCSLNKQHVCFTGPAARGQRRSSAHADFDESTPFPREGQLRASSRHRVRCCSLRL